MQGDNIKYYKSLLETMRGKKYATQYENLLQEIKKLALKRPAIVKWMEGKIPTKVIYIKGKIVSIVL